MKLKALIGDLEREVEVIEEAGGISVLIDGESKDLEVSEPEKSTFLFKTPSGVFEAYVFRNPETGVFDVSVSNRSFEVGLQDPKRLQSGAASSGSADGLAEIKSAMPGKVVKLLVEEGNSVAEGGGVVIVEAMKMQNELKSPKEGIVKEIRVVEDERVESGAVLAIIE
ncbi:MAG: hypothetical protein HKN33_15025 [Pyrinomonadaceae bacterium]|nr:hypothetical protein [Pyrinomonadaceae bacterium]